MVSNIFLHKEYYINGNNRPSSIRQGTLPFNLIDVLIGHSFEATTYGKIYHIEKKTCHTERKVILQPSLIGINQ